ncbi:MAG: CIA30 family protein [Kiritimatiellae bacterium]|nr:CIA30 family protein [Kiritimatiellia bacterium]
MHHSRRAVVAMLVSVLPVCSCLAQAVIEDFEHLDAWKVDKSKAKIAAATPAAVGESAIQVTFPGMAYRRLYKSPPLENADWDSYEGISFYARGDGSDLYGCLALGGRSWQSGHVYVYYFPLRHTDWRPYTIAWDDLVPESDVLPIGRLGALPPSGIQHVRLGSRWQIGHNNARIPPHTYSVDHIALAKKVPRDRAVPAPRPFAEVAARLKSGAALHVVCMGDSITAGTSLKDKDASRYATQTQNTLRQWLKRDNITVESRAVGGAKGWDLRAWVHRDFEGEPPDLVTVLFGYNDKSAALAVEGFRRSLNDYIDRVARKTGGKTAILLLPTIPGKRHRFVMMDDYAECVREVAARRGLAMCDVQKVFKALGREGVENYFADMAHPNEAGHQLMADTLARFLMNAAGIAIPDAAAAAP